MADAPLYSERLIDALGAATRLHAGQRRKGSDIPYLSYWWTAVLTEREKIFFFF